MHARISRLIALCLVFPACASESDVSFFVLVKSSNYAQDSLGTLTLLNYHFFSEVFLKPDAVVHSASLSGPGDHAKNMSYQDRGDNFYIEGGHFDTMEQLDSTYPNGKFRFTIKTNAVTIENEPLTLSGPNGSTDIPVPITISMEQSGSAVSPMAVDQNADLVVRWSEYSNGVADPRGVVDDMIFVVVADCHGDRLFHTGLPFQGEYMTYRTTEVMVPSGTLRSGQPHSMFVEFPHVVDSKVIDTTPGFTSYATATYLDLQTIGLAVGPPCPAAAPPMDTGQTDRMETRPLPR